LGAAGVALACHGSPAEPPALLPVGRWTAGSVCLAVADAQCNLTVGCGHGQFPRPTVRANGTFDVDGTYRIEIGPVSIDPAPPAHFSGSINDSTITLRIVPTANGLASATYTLSPSS